MKIDGGKKEWLSKFHKLRNEMFVRQCNKIR